MTMEIAALAVTAIISFMIPFAVFICILKKGQVRKLSLLLLFVIGSVIYLAMQWGIKEQGLAWLFNHTNFMDFMNAHYIPYLLVVAAAGSVLALLPVFFVCIIWKKQISFLEGVVLGLGYTMTESIRQVGIRSVNTIVELAKGSDMELNSTSVELFLTGYERILMSVIQIAIFIIFIYFIEQNMAVRGGLIAVFCHMLTAFLPGFFIAFSLKDYFEVYDRSAALLLVYVVLTAAAVTGAVILYNLRYALKGKQ